MTKRNDGTAGWSGQGISQEDGLKWVAKQTSQECIDNAFGRGIYQGNGKGKTKVESDYTESGNPSKAAKSAIQNFNPDMGKGKPGTTSQTGFGKDED